MALRLIKSTDPLRTEHISLCVYALPDYGKTSLAFTASRPLLIDFDGLVNKARNRDSGDVIRLDAWTDLEGLDKKVDLLKYDTLCVDTAGRAVNLLQEHVKGLEMSNRQGDGNLSLKGWGVVKRLFKEWLDSLQKLNKDVVLLVHLAEEKSGDNMLDRLDVEGGSKAEIYKSALAICRIVIQGKNNQRFLDFSPRENAIGKNPGQLGLVPFDSPATAPNTLAIVLQQIKDHMNKPQPKAANVVAMPQPNLTSVCAKSIARGDSAEKLTYEMQEHAEARREAATEAFLKDTNSRIEEIKKLPTELKSAVHKQALALGLRYNKETNWYEPDPDAAVNRTAATGNNQATGKGKPAARAGKGNGPRELPGMAGAGAGGSVAAPEGTRA